MPPKKTQGTCVYCGKVTLVTHDHLPPSSLFQKPRPNNLLTVASCFECNNGASMDDEYFRLVLSIRHSAPRHITKQVADKALRGLARDEHARFRSSFFKGIQEVGIKAADGQVIGRGGAYNVDLLRLSNVVTRIMKGLYFHHYGSPLPTWCEVDAWSEDGLGDVDADTIQEIRKYVSHLQQGSPVEIGKGAFKYWHSPVSGGSDCYSTIWLLVFYESTAFFGVTVGHHQ